jgi:hypothetical protein
MRLVLSELLLEAEDALQGEWPLKLQDSDARIGSGHCRDGQRFITHGAECKERTVTEK